MATLLCWPLKYLYTTKESINVQLFLYSIFAQYSIPNECITSENQSADLWWRHGVGSHPQSQRHPEDSWPGRGKCHWTWTWHLESWWRHHDPWHHQSTLCASWKCHPSEDKVFAGRRRPTGGIWKVDLVGPVIGFSHVESHTEMMLELERGYFILKQK